MDKHNLIGITRTSFELHSFHVDQWLVVKAAPELREIEPAAAMLVQRNEVDGIRLVRRTDYVDHEFALTVTILKRLRAGVQETDPLMRANPGRDASWCETADELSGDVQRQVMRTILAKYLDESRLTPLEILHYEVPAKALDGAGTTVQGALQRLASIQVRGTRQTAVARMKELMAITDEALSRLIKASKGNPPPAIATSGLAALMDKPGLDPKAAAAIAFRAVAAHLAPAKTWAEKLDLLFRLWEPGLGVRHMRVLDSVAAEVLASPFALKELAGPERNRFDLVINAIDLYAGNLAQGAGDGQLPGVRALSQLLADGVLPRTIAELRHGLLRHLHSRLPLKSETGLREEMQATGAVVAHLKKRAPTLARDEEVLEAISTRADRLIQPESISEMLSRSRATTAKIDAILALVEAVPAEATKAKLAPYLRSLVEPEDIIREFGNRREAIKPLADTAQRIIASGLPAAARREIVEVIDTSIFNTIRTEVIGDSSITFTDRMLVMLRLCSNLPEGRAKGLAGDTLSNALKRPEFLLNYLERFTSPAEKRTAYAEICDSIAASGLVDRSLIPTAA